jgi:hypothetical protein
MNDAMAPAGVRTSLPQAEALGRIRDEYDDYDQQGGIV